MYPNFYYDPEFNSEAVDQSHPSYKEALELYKRGRALYQSDIRAGMELYKEALKLLPDSAFLHAKMFSGYMGLNQPEKAKEHFERSMELDPTNAVMISFIPEQYDLKGEYLVKYINDVQAYLNNSLPAVNAAMVHHGLATLYRKLGDTTREWNNLKLCNDLLFEVTIQTQQYNFFNYFIMRDAIFEEGKPDIVSENTSSKPLFIISMPRSGSTLTDQILATHSQVETLGESYNIDKVVERVDSVVGYSPKKIEHLTEISDGYIEALDSAFPDAKYVSDKMPTNYWKVAKIKRTFPNAKMIFCLRNPMAMGLSCYRERLGGESWQFCNNLEEIGKYYSHVYIPLVNFWKEMFPDDIFVLQYEDLITDFDTKVKELQDFLDLPYEDLSEFYKLDRGVTTISREQVRKPLYNNLDAWEKYEPYLDDLKKGLESKEVKRECNGCVACCIETEFNTPEFSKEYMTPCKYLCDTGCAIHETRFPVCKKYDCLWKQGFGTERDRPNQNGLIANVTNVNNGIWVSVRELGKDALTTTGKHFAIDLAIKHQVPLIVRSYDSDNQAGDLVIVKEGLMHRSKALTGDFVGWLNDRENIGIYKLVNHAA